MGAEPCAMLPIVALGRVPPPIPWEISSIREPFLPLPFTVKLSGSFAVMKCSRTVALLPITVTVSCRVNRLCAILSI